MSEAVTEQEIKRELDLACATVGCLNYSAPGHARCHDCTDDLPLPSEVADEKLRRERTDA